MRVGSKTDRGRIREQNEDALGYHGSIFVVADGMGGHEAGEVASAIAVENVLAAEPMTDPGIMLEDAVRRANKAIIDRMAEHPEWNGMGTTLEVLMITEERAMTAHVGDSRIYHLSGSALRQLTNDHSLVAELVKNGGLTEEEARYHPQRNIVTRALGTKGDLEIEINETPFEAGDKFLLCSDGLTSMVEDRTIEAILIKNCEPQLIADELVTVANDQGGYDNITVIVVEV